ncbi:NAD-binding protein [Suttonella sp. R2A3]|uniref:NAD-binding protein n=1 Tax=Suttonella sp. R2A3 TaxID=2908648 RepID=UPI001F36F4D7|nr:NAD-binding protein [Suttonella sp. R2A3]UJF24700.1 NAD-binding protein [Suttonella sp. R2A3]
MNEIIYLILRQVRRPALVVLGTYSVAVLGMSLIPMVGEDGEMTFLSVFQSFYWVSYTATTIGYGEVPVPFSDWQRIWVAFSIYYTVPAWLYAAGKIIGLMQDATFQHALEENRFARRVAKQNKRFVLICGFGESGRRLVDMFLADDYECVVIESDQNRVNRMALDPALHRVLAIAGDAKNVELLEKSGIRSPYCRAVIAITDNEAVNIKVALAARLLSTDRSRFKVVCRTFTRQGSANARSFNTDVVLNSNAIFAERLTIGLRRPSIAHLIELIHAEPGAPFDPSPQPPAGRWVLCGYDNLGKTLERYLDFEGVDNVVIYEDANPSETRVKGTGMEAVTLREAKIDRAQAIVAGRTNDPENLSIAMTAKAMHPSLFVVGKQNRSSDHRLFSAAGFDRVMEEADLIVSKCFPEIARPLLSRFLLMVRHQDEAWGKKLLERIAKLSGKHNPSHYILRVENDYAPAVYRELDNGHLLRLQSLWMHPHEPETLQDALPLLLQRGDQNILLPNAATPLEKGDRILIAYHKPIVVQRIHRATVDEGELYYAVHGREKTLSYVMSYIMKKLD